MIYPEARELVCVMPGRTEERAAEFLETLAKWFAMSQGEIENERIFDESVPGEADDVRLSRGGDGEAYRRLVERHQKYVGQIMRRFSRDKQVHEELVQDVFVEAYLSLGNFAGKAPFGHWIAKIATRVGYRYWKQVERKGQTEQFSVQEWDEVADKKGDVDASKAAALVHRMLAQLPPRDRLVLTLRYLERCDVAKTMRRTGWTKIMVKVQTWRALRKMERLLTQTEKD